MAHLVALPLSLLSRDWAQKNIHGPLCLLVVRLLGIKVREHRRPSSLLGQAVYISNHRSTLDIFLFLALAIDRCRFFLTGHDWYVFPIKLPAWGLQTFFTPSQQNPSARRVFFTHASSALKATGQNCILSPEGKRNPNGDISNFNKGSFHLAMSLGVPIVPLYIRTDDQVNPGLGYETKAGQVDIYWGDPIPTFDIAEDDLPLFTKQVQDYYQEFTLYFRTRAPISESNPFRNFVNA